MADLEVLLKRAETQRPDLAADRSLSLAALSQVRSARAERRPSLGLLAGDESHAEGPTEHLGTSVAVGLELAIPLFGGGRHRAQLRAAEARRDEADARLRLHRDQISLEVRAAALSVRSVAERRHLAAAAVALAERSLIIVEDRYREGLTTLPELLDAQVALAEARTRALAAQRDAVLAHARLDLATGDL